MPLKPCHGEGGPGFRRLRAHPDYPDMVKRTLAEQAKAVNEVKREPVTFDPRASQRGYPKIQKKGK